MKKIVCIALMIVFVCVAAIGMANVQWFDTTWGFSRAQIRMPDDSIIEGRVQSWKDFADSDAVQVRINGVTYLTHYTNVVLMTE